MKKNTAHFLATMNAMNNRIAEEAAKPAPKADIDQFQLKRDAERREKQGQLRAREHPRSRPKNAHPVFGHVDLTRE